MNRNTIIGLLLIFAILIGYSLWMTPSQEEKEAFKRKQDSTLQSQKDSGFSCTCKVYRTKETGFNQGCSANRFSN